MPMGTKKLADKISKKKAADEAEFQSKLKKKQAAQGKIQTASRKTSSKTRMA